MKPIYTNVKYTEWLSADEMHEESKKWLSELEFYKEEQWFFEDLIRSYTLQILDHDHFEESKNHIDKLSEIVEQTQMLINTVKSHEKELSINITEDDYSTPEAFEVIKGGKNIYVWNIYALVQISSDTYPIKYSHLFQVNAMYQPLSQFVSF